MGRAVASYSDRNLLRDRWRRGDDESWQEIPEHGFHLDLDVQIDVRAAMGALKPRERELLWLAYVEGMGHAEIAAATGLEACDSPADRYEGAERYLCRFVCGVVLHFFWRSVSMELVSGWDAFRGGTVGFGAAMALLAIAIGAWYLLYDGRRSDTGIAST